VDVTLSITLVLIFCRISVVSKFFSSLRLNMSVSPHRRLALLCNGILLLTSPWVNSSRRSQNHRIMPQEQELPLISHVSSLFMRFFSHTKSPDAPVCLS
jgi:hypothetical protein